MSDVELMSVRCEGGPLHNQFCTMRFAGCEITVAKAPEFVPLKCFEPLTIQSGRRPRGTYRLERMQSEGGCIFYEYQWKGWDQ